MMPVSHFKLAGEALEECAATTAAIFAKILKTPGRRAEYGRTTT